MNRRIVSIVAVAAAVVGGVVAAPRRYEVDGISMGPGLLPGDVVATGWLPAADRWRSPEQFDRWIVRLPDGSTGLKRVVGLPGEEVALVAGDLVSDGRMVLKGPQLLAMIGSPVEMPSPPPEDAASWSLPAETILDDAAFATGEVSRLMLPVHDVGCAAEIDVPAAAGGARIKASAGPLAVTWRLRPPGRYAVVAGRLDGQAVAAAWPLPDEAGGDQAGRRCLPRDAPDRWTVVRPWPLAEAGPAAGRDDDRGPTLGLAVLPGEGRRAIISRVQVWRDILYRPAADGVTRWRLGSDEFFLLGDFPSGSRDSRHFGPLPRSALRHRLTGN